MTFVLSSSLRILQTPFSSLRAPDPFLLLGDPGLLINLLGIDSLTGQASRLPGSSQTCWPWRPSLFSQLIFHSSWNLKTTAWWEPKPGFMSKSSEELRKILLHRSYYRLIDKNPQKFDNKPPPGDSSFPLGLKMRQFMIGNCKSSPGIPNILAPGTNQEGGRGGLGEDSSALGFPHGASGKEPAYQYMRQKRHRFNRCVGKIPWRRAWQPTLVFLPGEPHGQRSLAGYSPWGCRVGHS